MFFWWIVFIGSAIAVWAIVRGIIRSDYGESSTAGEWYQFSDIKDFEEYEKCMKYSERKG